MKGGVSSCFAVLLAAVLLMGTAATCVAESNTRNITVVFRYDDYSSRSATYIERRLMDTFARAGMSCTFGVIPFVCAGSVQDVEPQDLIPLSQAKIDMLRAALDSGSVDLALHGYSHQTVRKKTIGRKATEFEGLDYQSQLLKLRAGKEFLEKKLGRPADVFITPWSTGDAGTVRALEALDFKCISSNLTDFAPDWSKLKFLPSTCTVSRLRNVIENARKSSDINPVICAVFHDYEFKEINYPVDGKEEQIGFEEFENLLWWIKEQPDINVASIGGLINTPLDLGINRLVNNKYYVRLAHLKPDFWPPPIWPLSSSRYSLQRTGQKSFP